ncbi:MAG: taurine ABC transporter substrate-binding protein [Spirochaetaceae bacterium]|nr:MAG: taurine ABC transporter substrate-binding protein [Spirochaetaceae bacterium]
MNRRTQTSGATLPQMLLTGVLAMLIAAQPVFSAGRAERDLREVVIGYQAIPNGEMIAKNLGWHEESFGVGVRWVQFNSGSELNAAVAAGSVDLGLGGSSTTVAAITQGVPAEVIWIYNIIGDNEALVVRADGDVRQVADLAGRRVAAPFGATTHYHLLAALELAGVDPNSLTILDMSPGDMRAAWQRGDIDAGFVWEPTLAAMLELGGRVLITSGELAAQGFLTGDIGIVRSGFAERHPELVVRYLKNQMRAVDFIRDDPEQAAQSIAEEFGIEAQEALRQMSTLVFLSGEQQTTASYLGRTGRIGELADVFVETGQFLADQGAIREAPARDVFERAINPGYLEQALNRN